MDRVSKLKPAVSVVLLVLATVFVAGALLTELIFNKTIARSTAQIDVDRCELMLRINDSLISIGNLFLGPKEMDNTSESAKQLAKQALPLLISAHSQNPNDPVVVAKAMIVAQYLGEPGNELLSSLKSMTGPKASALALPLERIYGKGVIHQGESEKLAQIIDSLLPPSWYSDQARLALYKKAQQHELYLQLEERLTIRSFVLFARILMITVLGTLLSIGGVIVLIVQIFSRRPLTPPEELAQIRAPANYGWLSVYAVFIAWLATQVACGVLAQPFVKGLSAGQIAVTGTAAIMALVYIVSNGPGLVYIYLFALRPHQLEFFDALKIRLRYGIRGPGKQLLAGFLAWMAAIPIMELAYYISTKYLGSEGSNNPIIAIVTDAARHESFSATLLFYITLGVLAPICEETMFRGFLYTYLRRYWGVLPCTLLSAAFFSVAHLDPGGFLPLFCLGSVFAIVLEKTKSIVPAMIAHALWNSCTFTLVILLFGS
jgi:membrane protease YdiL (CAAX protease family)